MRREKRVEKNKKRIIFPIIITIFIIFLVFGATIFGILMKDDYFERNTAEAVNIEQTLNLIYKENPVRMAIDNTIKSYVKEKADLQLNEKREKLAAEEKLAEENGKIAYLTFDDGPSLVVTPQVLDVLDEYDIKATFFLIGYMAERHPGIVKMTYDRGHSIGNHTYSHNYGYIYRNSKNLLNDIKKSDDLYKEILGSDFTTKLMRFPGGSFGKEQYIKAVEDAGYVNFDWNALNGDAEGLNIPKEKLVSRLKQTVKDQDRLIVLMHDTDYKPTTVEALGDIIEYLKSEGYVFRTLDQYIESNLEE